MTTYQDLLAVGPVEQNRIDFILAAIAEHQQSDAYKLATDAEAYYHGENPTIMRYEKIVRDALGKVHKNTAAANHKIASSFLKFAIRQKCSYLLGNGVTFTNPDTKKKLGRTFDGLTLKIAKAAKIEGVCFGFWNYDHIERFKFTEFVPLYDEEDGTLKAGVRFWQLAPDKPRRITLFELDGYTDYIQNKRDENEPVMVLNEKRPYKTVTRWNIAEGEEILAGKNYPSFPIVPLKNGTRSQPELKGRQGAIDALDLLSSGMVNNVDEASIIYWLIQGAGGMDEVDDANFLAQVVRSHVAHAETDQSVSPHQLEAPVAASESALAMLRERLYSDFSCVNPTAITVGNQTATAILANYSVLDQDTDDFETYVTDFIEGILALAGIDDVPTYTRSRIVNASEELQKVIEASQFTGDAYTTKKILTILGDADQYEAVQAAKLAAAVQAAQQAESETAEGG